MVTVHTDVLDLNEESMSFDSSRDLESEIVHGNFVDLI